MAKRATAWSSAALCLLCLPVSIAIAQASYEGTYRASPLQSAVRLEAWPPACGDPPRAEHGNEGLVRVAYHAGHLRFVGVVDGRTNGCFGTGDALSPVSASTVDGRFVARCEGRRSDGISVRVEQRLTGRAGETLRLLRTTRLEGEVRGERCEATVRSTRAFAPILPEEEAALAAESDVAPFRSAVGPCEPGPAASLRVSQPGRPLRAGERFCFRASADDADGCPLPSPALRLELIAAESDDANGTIEGRCFVAPVLVGEGTRSIDLVARSGAALFRFTIEVRPRDLSTLVAEREEATPEENPDRPGHTESVVGVAARSAEDETSELGRAVAMAVAAGLLVLALGLSAFALATKRGSTERTRKRPVAAHDVPLERRSVPDADAPPRRSSASWHEPGIPQMLCPKCGMKFGPGVGFCSRDGTALEEDR